MYKKYYSNNSIPEFIENIFIYFSKKKILNKFEYALIETNWKIQLQKLF